MDQQLVELLERAKMVNMTEGDLHEHRIALAVANGAFSDSRVTVETMRATVALTEASEKTKDDRR